MNHCKVTINIYGTISIVYYMCILGALINIIALDSTWAISKGSKSHTD